MYEVPTSLNISGTELRIRNKGDYRVILDCFSALNDINLTEQFRIMTTFIIFFEDINSFEDLEKIPDLQEALEKMYNFFNCNQPESPNTPTNTIKLIDWESDSQLICSAINNVSHMEIRSVPYIHWWTFVGYYMSIGESVLASVVSIRSKIAKGKKLEKYESEFKRNNPAYFNWNSRTIQQQEDDDYVRQLWNSGK